MSTNDHSRASLLLAGSFLAATVFAQEPTVILKSLDNLEKRLVKIESETGKLKKGGVPAAPDKSSAKADSSMAVLSTRLDSLLSRFKTMEAAAQPRPADSAQAQVAAADKEANAELVGEIRSLTTLLKQEHSAQSQSTTPDKSAIAAKAATPAAAATAPAVPVPGLEIKGDIQIQGERKLTSQSKRDNLDDFWGRLNFGAEYKSGDFESKLNVRIFPEGFGFEPLTGATFDTVGQGSVKVQSQPTSRIVINHAWAKYTVGITKVKVGRFETVETQSDNFGNYIDLGPTGKFMSRPAAHNALELTAPVGPVSSSVLLGTGDKKLNRGFLRLYEKYSPTKEIALAAGYRANVFDSFHFPDDEIVQRYDVSAAWKMPGGWKTFAEAALLQAVNKKDDKPLLLGVQPNVGKVLDLVSVEAEYLADRKAAGKPKEWLFNVHARKTAGRFKLDAGLYSDPADKDWNTMSFGLRMTSNIK